MGNPAPAPAPPAPPAAAPVDRVGELERLARLYQDGNLTDDELQDAKRRLLET
jgi:hypothetical protein